MTMVGSLVPAEGGSDGGWVTCLKIKQKKKVEEPWASKVLTPATYIESYKSQVDETSLFTKGETKESGKVILETKGILSLSPCLKERERVHKILQPSLRPLRVMLRVIGILPYHYNDTTFEYQHSWRSWTTVHTLLTAVYTSVLIVTSVIGLSSMWSSSQCQKQDKNIQAIKLTGLILVSETLVNAWAQVLSALYAGHRLTTLLNTWNSLVAITDLDPTKGLRHSVFRQIAFLGIFTCVLLIMTLIGQPMIVTHALDGAVEGMFMVPPTWTSLNPLTTKVSRSMS